MIPLIIKKIGTRQEVFEGVAEKTKRGIVKVDLFINKKGNIVTYKESNRGKGLLKKLCDHYLKNHEVRFHQLDDTIQWEEKNIGCKDDYDKLEARFGALFGSNPPGLDNNSGGLSPIEFGQSSQSARHRSIVSSERTIPPKNEADAKELGELELMMGINQPSSFDPFGPVLKKMSGISQLYYHKLPNGNRYLLLGENHDPGRCQPCAKEDCMNVDQYVTALVAQQRECIDFFIEDAIVRRDRTHIRQTPNKVPGGVQGIDSSREYWNDMDVDGTYAVPYLRIHGWDLRQNKENPLNEGIWFTLFTNINMNELHKFPTLEQIFPNKTMKEIIGSVADFTWGDHLRDAVPIVRKIFEVYGGGELTKDIKSAIMSIRKQTKKALSKISDLLQIPVPELKSIYKEVWIEYTVLKPKNKIVGFLTFSTDIYLFSRMFTKFKNENMSRGPRGCKQTETPKNVIVYGGAEHIIKIHGLFQRIFKTSLQYSKVERKLSIQCVRFDEPKQFF